MTVLWFAQLSVEYHENGSVRTLRLFRHNTVIRLPDHLPKPPEKTGQTQTSYIFYTRLDSIPPNWNVKLGRGE